MNFHKDYYTILGVPPASSKEQIRAAYRQLAKQYHPDRMPDADPLKMQEINEAYDVLGDPLKRANYDAHFREKDQPGEPVSTSSARTYERRFTVTEIEKIYLKGSIKVKFWADAIEDAGANLYTMDYRLHPSEVVVSANEEDIGIRQPAESWKSAVEASELFQTPLIQPVRCEIMGSSGVIVYLLNLHSIRVANIELVNIVKHNEQSLGTLLGDLYAELIHTKIREETEWVTEEEVKEPAASEKKAEKASQKKGPMGGTARRTTATWPDAKDSWVKRSKSTEPLPERAGGCGSWLLFGFLIFLFLSFIIGGIPVVSLLITLVLLTICGVFLYWIRYILPVLYLMGIGSLVFASLWSALMEAKKGPVTQRKPAYDTPVVTQNDSLRIHSIRWKDYDSNYYEIDLPVRLQAISRATEYHQWLSKQPFKTLGAVYDSMALFDEEALENVHNEFELLRTVYALDEYQLANAMVSCIQSVPYYLVLQDGCSDSSNTDVFVRDYLKQCERECCIGDIGFGVRSPVEFLSDLKGDCDTRALLLFALFKRFDYDVAIIESEQYRHAAIAVALNQVPQENPVVFKIGEKKLYAWETTGSGFRAGQLPDPVKNLRKWQISLFHSKNKP